MNLRKILRVVTLAVVTAGGLYACEGCLCNNLWRFNPCGTILSTTICTPTDWYARVFDSPNWHVDPTCPIPFQCGPSAGGPQP